MTVPDDDLHIRPGRIRDRSSRSRSKSFVAQVRGAAQKAEYVGRRGGRAISGRRSGSVGLEPPRFPMSIPRAASPSRHRIVLHRAGSFSSTALSHTWLISASADNPSSERYRRGHRPELVNFSRPAWRLHNCGAARSPSGCMAATRPCRSWPRARLSRDNIWTMRATIGRPGACAAGPSLLCLARSPA